MAKKIELESEQDVATAVDEISEIAENLGFGKFEISQIALAVSEIAGNAIKFATKGVVEIKLAKNKKVLELIVRDKGPGIKNIKKVMAVGYKSQSGGLGLGLVSAKRAMDEFHIRSKVGQGTVVTMRKYLPIPEEKIQYGVVSFAAPGENVNGDAYVIKEFEGDKVLLAVIDGVGEGIEANKAANVVKDLLENSYQSGLIAMVSKCDRLLRKRAKKKGVVMSLLLLKPQSLEYLGIGDTFIEVISPDKKISLFNQGGIIGEFRLPTLKVQKQRVGRELTIMMCSDGIRHGFTAAAAAAVLPLDKSAQKIADFIMNNFQREYGDATVLVAKWKK